MDNGIPSLTLEPNAMAAPAAPTAIEAPSMPQAVAAPAQPQAIQVSAVPAAPTLTLNPEAEQQNGQQAQQEANPIQVSLSMSQPTRKWSLFVALSVNRKRQPRMPSSISLSMGVTCAILISTKPS